MAENTKIEWCDHTASPWHGCTKVADGCQNCYAEALSKRNPGVLGIWGDDGVRIKSKSFIPNLRKWNESAHKRGVVESVFPSLCDPFEDRPELVDWRNEMFAVADECPHIRLLLLTKRPENVRRMWLCSNLEHRRRGDCSKVCSQHRPNVWLLTSIATQADADRNIPELLKCRDICPVLGVSAEPLIEAMDITRLGEEKGLASPGVDAIDWVIIGGESGPHARPCDVAWIRSIKQQCGAAGVPLFVKQFGARILVVNDSASEWPRGGDGWIYDADQCGWKHQGDTVEIRLTDPKGGDWDEWPEDLRVRQWPKGGEP